MRNYEYYSSPSPGNIWNNPNRISAKQSIYYHQPKAKYEENNLKDSEKLNIAENENQQEKRNMLTQYKSKDIERLQKRKTERMMVYCLQLYSSQVEGELSEQEKIHKLATTSPMESKELTLKKASTFKDPVKLDASEVEHIKYSTLGKKQLTNLLRPNVIKGDLRAIETIKSKIEKEREADLLLKSWYSDQKKLVQDQLAKRHEEMHCLSKKSGIQDREEINNFEGFADYKNIDNIANPPLSTRTCQPPKDFDGLNDNKQIPPCSEQAKSQATFKIPIETVFQRLDKPKKPYIPEDLYTHAEFRGLIHSDYSDVVAQSNNAGLSARKSRRFSHISEEFPTPHFCAMSQTCRQSRDSQGMWSSLEAPLDSRKFIKYMQHKQLEAISKQEEENREKKYNLKLAEDFEMAFKRKPPILGVPYAKLASETAKANL